MDIEVAHFCLFFIENVIAKMIFLFKILFDFLRRPYILTNKHNNTK